MERGPARSGASPHPPRACAWALVSVAAQLLSHHWRDGRGLEEGAVNGFRGARRPRGFGAGGRNYAGLGQTWFHPDLGFMRLNWNHALTGQSGEPAIQLEIRPGTWAASRRESRGKRGGVGSGKQVRPGRRRFEPCLFGSLSNCGFGRAALLRGLIQGGAAAPPYRYWQRTGSARFELERGCVVPTRRRGFLQAQAIRRTRWLRLGGTSQPRS